MQDVARFTANLWLPEGLLSLQGSRQFGVALGTDLIESRASACRCSRTPLAWPSLHKQSKDVTAEAIRAVFSAIRQGFPTLQARGLWLHRRNRGTGNRR